MGRHKVKLEPMPRVELLGIQRGPVDATDDDSWPVFEVHLRFYVRAESTDEIKRAQDEAMERAADELASWGEYSPAAPRERQAE